MDRARCAGWRYARAGWPDGGLEPAGDGDHRAAAAAAAAGPRGARRRPPPPPPGCGPPPPPDGPPPRAGSLPPPAAPAARHSCWKERSLRRARRPAFRPKSEAALWLMGLQGGEQLPRHVALVV